MQVRSVTPLWWMQSCVRLWSPATIPLADACGQIIGLLAAASAAGAVPGAASVSNDGYSVTFGSNASVTAAARQEAYEIIRTALGSDPHGLLYRGIL